MVTRHAHRQIFFNYIESPLRGGFSRWHNRGSSIWAVSLFRLVSARLVNSIFFFFSFPPIPHLLLAPNESDLRHSLKTVFQSTRAFATLPVRRHHSAVNLDPSRGSPFFLSFYFQNFRQREKSESERSPRNFITNFQKLIMTIRI